MTTPELFPILDSGQYGKPQRYVPWALVGPHEAQAQRNHYQTLKRLAERGGLSPAELVAVLEDRAWRSMTNDAAETRLQELIAT